MTWNEYSNTWNKKPDMPDGWNKKPVTPNRLDVSKMELTEVSLITDGKIIWTINNITKVYPDCEDYK